MRKYHLVGKYSGRFSVEYRYNINEYAEVRYFRSWENAYSYYRRKCKFCDELQWMDSYDEIEEVRLFFDDKLIMEHSSLGDVY